MRADAHVQVILVKIYTALVQTIDYIVNAPVVFIRRLESKPSRRRDNPLSCFVP